MTSGEKMGAEIKKALAPANLRDVFTEIQGSMTCQEFADVLGVSESHVSRIARGKRKVTGVVLKALFQRYPERAADLLAGIRSERQ